jgi:hypothetical protein
MDNEEIAAKVRTVRHRARLRRAGRRPSLIARLASWLLVTLPSPSRERARVRGRLERLKTSGRFNTAGSDAP